MKLAVSYENGQVSPHFGQSKQFQFYDVADGVATPGQVLDVPGAGHAAATAFLAQQGAQAVISGFVGGGARQALEQAGIALYPNVTGAAQERAQQLAQGTLVCGEEAPGAAGCAGHSQVEAHGIGHEPCAPIWAAATTASTASMAATTAIIRRANSAIVRARLWNSATETAAAPPRQFFYPLFLTYARNVVYWGS